MGERHQLFVIAKVGRRYRRLAAIHNQWLSGITALMTCIRVLHIFKSRENHTAIRQELRFAEELFKNDPDFGVDRQETGSSPNRFPFILSCMIAGTSSDPDNHRFSVVHVGPDQMNYNQGDNNDGITIFDITDLDRPRYCFVVWGNRFTYDNDDDDDDDDDDDEDDDDDDDDDNEDDDDEGGEVEVDDEDDDDEVDDDEESEEKQDLEEGGAKDDDDADDERPPKHAPLTASQYVGLYGSIERAAKELAELKHFETISEAAFYDAYPSAAGARAGAPVASGPLGPVNPTGAASLAEITVQKFLSTTLAEDDFDLAVLGDILLLPNFPNLVLGYLCKHGNEIPDSPTALNLLALALKDRKCVDLSFYRQLSPASIITLLQRNELRRTRELNLSGLELADTATEVGATLASLPELQDLYLMSRPDRTSDEDAAKFIKMLGGMPHLRKTLVGSAMSAAANVKFWLPSAVPDEVLPAGPSFPVCQMLFRGGLRPRWTILGANSEIEPEIISLADSLITPTRGVTGFLSAIRSLAYEDRVPGDNRLLSIAMSFATAPARVGDQESCISMIPAEAYVLAKNSYHSSLYIGSQNLLRDITPHSWTILVDAVTPHPEGQTQAHVRMWDRDPKRFKYAFVRARDVPLAAPELQNTTPGMLEVLDLVGFCKATLVDYKELDSCLGRLPRPGNGAEPLIPMTEEEACEIVRETHKTMRTQRRMNKKLEGFGAERFYVWPDGEV